MPQSDFANRVAEGNASWRKIVVGDRNWRILFRIDEQNTVATVMALGARGNGECYRIAEQRLAAPQGPQRQSVSPVPSRSFLNRAAAEAATRIRPRF